MGQALCVEDMSAAAWPFRTLTFANGPQAYGAFKRVVLSRVPQDGG